MIALAVMCAIPLHAQERSLTIAVKDGSGAPATKAYVSLLRHREVKPPKSKEPHPPTVDSLAETDVRGEAILKVDKRHRYRLEVRCQGFLPWTLDDFRPRADVFKVVLGVGHIVVY